MSDSASTVRASDSPEHPSRRHWLALAVAASTGLTAGPLQARSRRAAPAALPAPLAEPVDVLPAGLKERLVETGLSLDGFGLHVQALDGAAAVLSWQAGRPFVLASTSKLITSMAALDLLGPAYRWRTRAYLSGPLTNGRLLGDLVIRGGGDASLTSQDLLAWFQELRAQGLQEVWGDIILNRDAFSLRPQDLSSTPEPSPDRPHHVRPDALDNLPPTPENQKFIAAVRPAFEKYKSMGVRIEDDMLITPNGVDWMTKALPRTIADIEAFIARARASK